MVFEEGTFEISLESLGLKLSTLPPECLPEKKEAESQTSQCSKKNVVFISDVHNNKTRSIVVLDEDLLCKIQTQSLARYELIYQKSLSLDYKSIISGLTTSELQQKLFDISQENLRLKQTLENNASSMKHALNIIASKQAELVSAHDARQQKVIEMKNQLHILRKEGREYPSKTITQQSGAFNYEREKVETAKREDMTTTPTLLAEKSGDFKMAGIMKKCGKQDRKLVKIPPVPSPADQQPITSSKNIAQQTEAPPIEFARLTENLQALGDCCAVDMYSRFTSISDGLRRCQQNVADNGESREIEESLRFLEALIGAELTHLRNVLTYRMTKNNSESECETEVEMEMGEIFSSYNSKLRDIKYMQEAKKPLNTFKVNENFDQPESPRERKMVQEDTQSSLEKVKLSLMRQEEEIDRERIRMQSKERQLIEANVNLHEEIDRLRESNNVFRLQLTVYENDWVDQKKVCEMMRKKENELLDHISNLEEEKTQWLTAMQSFQRNAIG